MPYFGICLGMQMAVMEYARHVLGCADAHSSEFDPETSHNPVIDLMPDQQGVTDQGRHHAPGRVPLQASHPAPRPGRALRRRRRSTSATATAMSSTTSSAPSSRQQGLVIAGTSPDGRLVESSWRFRAGTS